jgi:hypothetical protein
MVPLYAVQVQNLGTGDFVVVKCGACGDTTEIPPSRLIRELSLQLTDRVLDLQLRLPCRLCYARGQSIVSVKWQASALGRD